MAKAHIEGPDGVTVKLEGTAEEVAAVLKEIKVRHKEHGVPKSKKRKTGGKATLTTLLEDLRNEGFFKKAKTMSDIQGRLADLGHSYPLTGLSGPLRREVRAKRLRRFKENRKYVYAQ